MIVHLVSAENENVAKAGFYDILVKDCHLEGYFTTTVGPIQTLTTAPTRVRIENNTLKNLTDASTKVIDLVAQSEVTVINNRIYILSGTAPVDDAGVGTSRGLLVGGNYYKAATAVTAGTLL